jgi:hypothetical protein
MCIESEAQKLAASTTKGLGSRSRYVSVLQFSSS